MTFGELKKRMARRTGKNSATLDPVTDARFMDFLNEAHAQLLRAPGRESLRYAVVPFTTEAGKAVYAMPSEATRINRILDKVNDRRLEYRTPDWLDTVEPDPKTGTPWAWLRRGYAYVFEQPRPPGRVLWVRATSAANTTQIATVEGLMAGGRVVSQSVQLAGTTPVSIGPHEIAYVSRFYLSAPSVVYQPILLEDEPMVNTISIIEPFNTRQQYQLFELFPTPAAAQAYTLDLLLRVPTVVAETEEPILPPDFHEILIPMALLREFTKADDPSRWEQARLEAKQGLMALDTFLTAHPDWNPQWGGPEVQMSRLGSWFPAGS